MTQHDQHQAPHPTLGTVRTDREGHGGAQHAPAGHGGPGAHPEDHATDGTTHGAGGGHGAGAEGHEGHHELKPVNWADFSQKGSIPYVMVVVNFALLCFVLYKLLAKPIADGLKERRATVAKQIEEAQRIKKEAEARSKKYKTQLASLDDELATARQALLDAGEADKARILREAEEKAARLEREALALLEQEKRQAQQDLLREAVEAAVANAEELLKKKVTHDDQERLAEEYLTMISKRVATPGAGHPSGAST